MKQRNYFIRFEVLTAVKMSMLVFWVITPCELEGPTFRRNILPPSSGLKMLVSTYNSIRHYYSEDQYRKSNYLIPLPLKCTNLSTQTTSTSEEFLFLLREHDISYKPCSCLIQGLTTTGCQNKQKTCTSYKAKSGCRYRS
jgi:hypothetical protein